MFVFRGAESRKEFVKRKKKRAEIREQREGKKRRRGG
jgi:hypothetical protein